MLFAAAGLLIQILFLQPSPENIIRALFLQQAGIPQFRVLQSSYGFVPIYIKTLFVAIMVIKFLPRLIPIYIFAVVIYILLHSYVKINATMFLGPDLRTAIFYSLIIRLGYRLY